MPNRLAQAEQRLADLQEQHASTRVKYARVEADVCLPAVIGRSEWDVVDASGLALRVETRDFIIKTAKLVLDDVEIEPKAGDLITEGELVYMVAQPGPDLPVWRWAEPSRLRRRIFTKLSGSLP